MSKKNYESDVTLFLKQLKKDKPDLQAKQVAGRARLWDKDINAEQQEQFKAARVPQSPYVYQTK
ncbi:MAG: DUF3460 family protein [Pelistega sp.]|nr:DUF3460 family protein [Pelistega sp.]